MTSSFLSSYIKDKNHQIINEKINALSRDIEMRTQDIESGDQAFLIAENFLTKLKEVHSADLSFYTLDPKEIHKKYFNYAYFKKQENPRSFTELENNSKATSYIAFNYNSRPQGYIKANFDHSSARGFNVLDFLGSIFNVYVFLFLLASVIAVFMARSIIRPLALLNQKLSELKIGKTNELINWEREDEIGQLINNYNSMVQKLGDSVDLLAKTERDNAWREMAKQVAHEIKNPLTPMKMYIQHLEKAIKQRPENAIDLTKRISSTLLEQVENLTQIADSFSNFAELPQSSNEKVELNKVVELVHNLFRKRDDMDIRLSEPIDPLYVYADKNQLIRILNNIVKNAIESIPKNQRGIIQLELFEKNDKAIIKVTDNGSGIAQDMQGKIFQPKFTTKDSGSGLGLAIAMNMIESMNGRIYFESQEGLGTSFFIELDIIRQNFDETIKRITLD